MPGANEAQAAARCHERVVLPLVDRLRRRGTLVRLAFGTIAAVDGAGTGYARVTLESGQVTVAAYGIITPAAGERWRLIDFGSGLVLDDMAVAAG